MINFIENYINNMSKDDFNKLALNKKIVLNNEELDFAYNYVKSNYKELLNSKSINLDNYKDKFREETLNKLKELLEDYKGLIDKFI